MVAEINAYDLGEFGVHGDIRLLEVGFLRGLYWVLRLNWRAVSRHPFVFAKELLHRMSLYRKKLGWVVVYYNGMMAVNGKEYRATKDAVTQTAEDFCKRHRFSFYVA